MKMFALTLLVSLFFSQVHAASECIQNASPFLKRANISSLNLAEEKGAFIEKEVLEYWKKHNSDLLVSPTSWGTRFKRKLVMKFQNINDNKIPVFYIDDKEETFVKINKYIEIVETKLAESELSDLEQEVIKSVHLWIERYSQYVDDVNKLVFEYLTYEMSIEQVRLALKKGVSFPHREHFVFLIDGQRIEKVKEFDSKEMMTFFIGKLKKDKRAIIAEGLTGEGKLFQRKLLQAEDHRRLVLLNEKVKDIVLTHAETSTKDHVELVAMKVELDKLLGDSLNNPSPKTVAKLANLELKAELKDFLKTADDHALIREGKKFYASLTPEQIKALGLSHHGRGGEIVQLVKNNKWTVFFTAVAGSGSVGGILIATKNVLMTDSEKRMKCAELSESDAFMGCFEGYMKDKFKLDYPLKYLLKGEKALADALNNDKQKISEFKAEYKIFLEIRADYEKSVEDETKFKEQFTADLKKYMSEVGEPSKIDQPARLTEETREGRRERNRRSSRDARIEGNRNNNSNNNDNRDDNRRDDRRDDRNDDEDDNGDFIDVMPKPMIRRN